MCDASVARARVLQDRLLQYRLDRFCLCHLCACGKNFVRGHEQCEILAVKSPLTKAEGYFCQWMALQLVGTGGKFTDVDWLLNTGKVERAHKFLLAVEKALNKVHAKAEAQSNGAHVLK